MPENAALAVCQSCVFCRLNRLFDCKILMIPSEYLESILPIHIKADEVLHDVKESRLFKQSDKECVKRSVLCIFVAAVCCFPLHKAVFAGGDGASL